uniref:Uncharacterized protein n=1 Tax=Timema cristinae TaxID=61476 RepID=A0A7R9CM52_TIMCR|nr:unnamed protein product [Timema cristinae]
MRASYPCCDVKCKGIGYIALLLPVRCGLRKFFLGIWSEEKSRYRTRIDNSRYRSYPAPSFAGKNEEEWSSTHVTFNNTCHYIPYLLYGSGFQTLGRVQPVFSRLFPVELDKCNLRKDDDVISVASTLFTAETSQATYNHGRAVTSQATSKRWSCHESYPKLAIDRLGTNQLFQPLNTVCTKPGRDDLDKTLPSVPWPGYELWTSRPHYSTVSSSS